MRGASDAGEPRRASGGAFVCTLAGFSVPAILRSRRSCAMRIDAHSLVQALGSACRHLAMCNAAVYGAGARQHVAQLWLFADPKVSGAPVLRLKPLHERLTKCCGQGEQWQARHKPWLASSLTPICSVWAPASVMAA